VNIFALVEFDDQGSLCTFYTLRWDDSKLSETEKFIQKFRKDKQFKDSLQQLAKFLEINIGNEHGALEALFRFENAAHALPKSGKLLVGEVTINYGNFPLRLYCLRISETLVILFNGGEKTDRTAQGGKTSMVFIEANQFAKRILEASYKQEIYITPNQREFRNFSGSEEIIL